MNANVTKSTKKSSPAEAADKISAKTAAASKIKPNTKPAVKSALKTVAGKLVKTIKNVLKPSPQSVSPVKEAPQSNAKPAARPSEKFSTKAILKTPVKSLQKAGQTSKADAAKAVTVQGKAVPEKATASAKQSNSSTVSPAAKKAAGSAVTVNAKAAMSGTGKDADVASAGLADKIERTVVSKVSEVATKTPKSTPAVSTDGTLLTEAQILKMSDKEYMNAAQLAFFKARLQQLEKDLLKNAGETTEHLRETVLVPDPADRATIEEEHALELRTRDRERKLLKKVQQSIASIDSGEYGWCEETGEPIGIPRLLARPTATLSLEAQQRRELKQKLYGD